jgi:acyl carrier protein phosphodiesterase
VQKLLLALLLALCFSFSAYSQEGPEDQIYQAAQAIVKVHPDMKPQIAQIAAALKKISQEQAQSSDQLLQIISEKNQKLAELQGRLSALTYSVNALTISQNDLSHDVNKWQALFAVSATIGGISIAVNLGQLLAPH